MIALQGPWIKGPTSKGKQIEAISGWRGKGMGGLEGNDLVPPVKFH